MSSSPLGRWRDAADDGCDRVAEALCIEVHPQNGVAYVVTGGGGRGTRPVGSSNFTAFAADVIHFLYLEVGVDELVMHAIDGTGAEFDSMVIAR